jgi:hypothetical protein
MNGLRWLVFAFVAVGPPIGGAEPRAPSLRPGEFFYQFRDEVVLWSTASARWGRGPYRLEHVPSDHSDQIVAARAVDARQLPPVLAQWLGHQLRLYAWDGTSCTAKITGFRLVGVATYAPPFAVKWNALLDPSKGDPTTGGDGWQEQSAMAEAAWNQGARLLVAELDRQEECAAAAWARAAELPEPARAADDPVSDSLRALAVDAFHSLPAWQRLQQRYGRSSDRRGQPEPSWDQKDHAQPYVQSFRLTSGGIERRIVSVYAVQDHPEAALDRRLWAIFELEGSVDRPVLALRDVASGRSVPAGLELYTIVDLHDDGGLALLYTSEGGNGLMLEAARTLVEQTIKHVPR